MELTKMEDTLSLCNRGNNPSHKVYKFKFPQKKAMKNIY